jgi:alpha-1,6-mannosyltransferase
VTFRVVGFAGAVLLAIGGFLAGARPGPAPASQAEALWGETGWFRLGLVAYVAGLVLLGWAWWRLKDQPLRLRWVLGTGALWALPLLVAPPLGSRDAYAYACHGAVWLDGHDPYAVGAAGGGCPWLVEVPSLWHDAPAPYGPLALLVSAAAVGLARLMADGESAQLLVALAGLRAAAVAGALLVAAYLPRLARSCGVDPARATWLGLVSPLVAVHVVAGAHHDALVAGLVVAALALAAPAASIKEKGARVDLQSRSFLLDRRGVGAGLALGLAVAVKVTAVAALPFVLLLASRRSYRSVGVVAVAAVGVFAGLTLATGLGVGWVGALSESGAVGQWSSLPTALGMAVGYVLWGLGAPGAFDGTVAVARGLGLAALAVVSLWLLARAWRERTDSRAVVGYAGVVLAAVVVLGPVVYPWYAVGALAVLAASTEDPRHRRWLAVATLVLTALTLPSGLGVPVLTRLPGALLVALLVGWAGWRWLRRRVRPRGPRVPVR